MCQKSYVLSFFDRQETQKEIESYRSSGNSILARNLICASLIYHSNVFHLRIQCFWFWLWACNASKRIIYTITNA